jgi:beta-glucosidase
VNEVEERFSTLNILNPAHCASAIRLWLSYTAFEYSGLTVSGQETKKARESDLTIFVRVRNTGIYPSHEVVELYISPLDSIKVWRPARELKGYAKV